MSRFAVVVMAMVAAMALAGCPSDPEAGPDAGEAAVDVGLAGMDAASPGADTGTATGEDASTPSADAGPVVGEDAAGPGPDTGVVEPPDAGGAEPDAGTDELFGKPKSPLFGAVVFNEVLTDGTTEGDPNGDGDANPVEDQFVELVNASGAAVAMDGYTLVDQDLADLPRHTFAAGFSLPAGHAVVVFGGGDAPAATATTTFFAANAADPGLPFGLHLASPSDRMLLLDADGKVVAFFCYGGTDGCALQEASDESLTRDPDVTGDFVPRRSATGSGGAAFSVGTKIDGSDF